MKVSVLGGAGGIGQPLSLLLKNGLPAGSELALYDVNPLVVGVAVDLSHIPTDVKVTGYKDDQLAECLKGTDVVVIPAGIVKEIAEETAEMTAFEDFVTEEVMNGRSILGLYPATDEQSRTDFAEWRKRHGR